MYVYVYIYIYIYTYICIASAEVMANLCTCTRIVDFGGFDSSILRGGIPRPIGNFPECLSQAILVGIMLVGRLGVSPNDLSPRRVRISKHNMWSKCLASQRGTIQKADPQTRPKEMTSYGLGLCGLSAYI